LLSFIQQRFAMKRASNDKNSSSGPNSPPNHAIDFPISDIVCPSSQPHPRAADPNSLHVPIASGGYMPPIISPIPVKDYKQNVTYPMPQGSQSSQDIHSLPFKDDTNSISSHRSGEPTSSSLTSLPLSHRGRVSNFPIRPVSRSSQRPNSRNSQQIKVSQTPSPAPSLNIARPAGITASPGGSSPIQLRSLPLIFAQDIQRWDRNIIMHVHPAYVLLDDLKSLIVSYSPTDVTCCIINPMEFNFSELVTSHPTNRARLTQSCRRNILPGGWISHVHPEGARYFFHHDHEKARTSQLFVFNFMLNRALDWFEY
jgi:hypothetical protein